MINYHQASLRSLSVHSVPGAQHEAEFLITKEPVILEDEIVKTIGFSQVQFTIGEVHELIGDPDFFAVFDTYRLEINIS